MSIDPTEMDLPPEIAAEHAAMQARADAAVAALQPELERLQAKAAQLEAAEAEPSAAMPALRTQVRADIAAAEVERLRARVAELEQQLWQIRDAMTDQHEAIGHALAVHAWGEEDPDCIAAADQMDGDLACEQWKQWQASFMAAMALNIGLRPTSATPPETDPDDDITMLETALGDMPVRFWSCSDHRDGRVEWRGDVAHCLTEGCGRTSAPPETAGGDPA